ncbi:response regulator [Neoroseomonas oryzicola]|uniref:Response regulator n=1 Tax=Neoroseomonas oryzicola TaxID=535904 RepID=A0A9X9WHF0_9PROT|nr:response regulator [Neoroseomonas oryzicola]MBR0659760.1 response regulator [Neoroseomonas oryzicola]NKE17190.1 response regulator [Neoroseomonas oryzicola]
MSPAGAKRQILVIEDEALVAMLVEDALLDSGFDVLGPARSVAEALELLEAEQPAAAVLDLNLGGENSLAVADALQARGIPFLVATGYGSAGLPQTHRHVPVLPKPYDPADLTTLVERLCDGR